MPLDHARIEVGMNALRDAVVCCRHCHNPAEAITTTDEQDAASYELICRIDGPAQIRVLGRWASEQERTTDQEAFLSEQHCQCHHPASDHRRGHCNGLLDRQTGALCPCGEFTLHR